MRLGRADEARSVRRRTMSSRLRIGCFTVVTTLCGASLAAYLFVRPDLAEFRDLVEKHSSQTYPPKVVQAILAWEDPFFFHRSRFDTIENTVLLWTWVRIRELRGSKIVVDRFPSLTEKLVRSQIEGRSLSRYFRTIVVCAVADVTVPRQKILNTYMNRVYLGRVGDQGIYGINEAALVYFGVPATQLTVAQTASLAATIRHPATFAPPNRSESAIRRRLRMLEEMQRIGIISAVEYMEARRAILAGAPSGG